MQESFLVCLRKVCDLLQALIPPFQNCPPEYKWKNHDRGLKILLPNPIYLSQYKFSASVLSMEINIIIPLHMCLKNYHMHISVLHKIIIVISLLYYTLVKSECRHQMLVFKWTEFFGKYTKKNLNINLPYFLTSLIFVCKSVFLRL